MATNPHRSNKEPAVPLPMGHRTQPKRTTSTPDNQMHTGRPIASSTKSRVVFMVVAKIPLVTRISRDLGEEVTFSDDHVPLSSG
jgi:hypothetical protein